MVQRLVNQAMTQGMVGKDLAVRAGLLQSRGDWALCVWTLLGSEEVLLEMSSYKFTRVAL